MKVKTLSGGQLVAALLAAEDSFTMLHPYGLLQDSCGAKFFGTLFTHLDIFGPELHKAPPLLTRSPKVLVQTFWLVSSAQVERSLFVPKD